MKRITKILLLTMLLTLCITSTCFASTEENDFIKNYISDYLSSNNKNIDYSDIIIKTDTGYYNRYVYFIGSDITGKSETTGVEIPIFYTCNFTLRGNFVDGFSISNFLWNSNITPASNYKTVIPTGSASYVPYDIYSDNGTLLLASTEKEPEPEIPDIPAISLPNSDHSKNYYFMYENNSGSTGLAVFSSNDEIIFNAVADNNSAYIDFTFTSPMNYSNYIFRDNEWIKLENAKYDEAGTKNVTIGYTTIISSSFDVLKTDGTVFFPQTPNLVEIAGTGLQEMWGTIMKAIMVILMIAVSLLALWISLVILLKVLRRFLV